MNAYRTFKGWQCKHRVVRAGEKATAHTTDGEALFTRVQTALINAVAPDDEDYSDGIDGPQEGDGEY